MTFIESLSAAWAKNNSLLCVGLDPDPAKFPAHLKGKPDAIFEFCKSIADATADLACCFKPQIAYFAAHRAEDQLQDLIAHIHATHPGISVILDAKRGDIGSTMDAYAEAFLGKDAPSPADAVTVSPYLGYGSLRPAIDLAGHTGRGVFVLALTSNPEGPSVQHAQRDGISVARAIVEGAAADNAEAASRGEMGHVGLVVGATIGSALADLGIDLAASAAPILAPGLGAQGATPADLRAVFGAALPQVLPNASRSILATGPDVSALRAAAREESERLAEMLAS